MLKKTLIVLMIVAVNYLIFFKAFEINSKPDGISYIYEALYASNSQLPDELLGYKLGEAFENEDGSFELEYSGESGFASFKKEKMGPGCQVTGISVGEGFIYEIRVFIPEEKKAELFQTIKKRYQNWEDENDSWPKKDLQNGRGEFLYQGILLEYGTSFSEARLTISISNPEDFRKNRVEVEK